VTFKEPRLWLHQAKALEMATRKDVTEFAFLFEMGTGKTLTTIKVMRYLYNKDRTMLPTLIVGPVIILENWKNEILKFSKIKEERICVLQGPVKKRIEKFWKYQKKFLGKFICITNYEGLSSSNEFFELLRDWTPSILVIDESQRIKSHNSKRTKLITDIADRATYRYLLTGTAILNSALDIYAQYRALDGGRTFGHNFYSFRAKYFYDKNSGMPSHKHFPDWKIRDGANEELNKKIYTKAMRAVKSECLDLPPLVKTRIPVEMSPKQARLYKEMEKHFIAYLDENTSTTADLALTKTLRMLQIVTGYAKDENEVEHSFDTPRKAALKELLADITPNHKVIVWACFKENYKQVKEVCNGLAIDYVEAHGSITNKNKYANVDKFNNDPDCRLFLGHPASLGIGINLVASSVCIYFSRGYSSEQNQQSEARNYRGGSEIHDKVTRIDLYTPGTIDEVILHALDKKLANAEEILKMIKKSLT